MAYNCRMRRAAIEKEIFALLQADAAPAPDSSTPNSASGLMLCPSR